MDHRSMKLMEDIVLEAREVTKSNIRTKSRFHLNNKKPKSNEICCLKIDAPTINISEEFEEQLFSALSSIYGTDFKLDDVSEYANNADKGKQYYLQRCQLMVIKEESNFLLANLNNEDDKKIEKNLSSYSELEIYNFHASHCSEALEYANGHIGKALELLFCKYYGIEELPRRKVTANVDFNNVLESKTKEKEELQFYYANCFKEDIANRVWIFQMKLDYLIENNDEIKQIKCKSEAELKSMCKLHLEGNCISGKNCQLLHENLIIKEEKEDKCDSTLFNDSNFTLEIRFPEDRDYPYDPPYFYFYKSDGTYPALNCLRIARRLHEEAVKFCESEKPFIASILQLLKNEQEIQSYLKEDKETFLNHDHPLFPDASLYNEKHLRNRNKTIKQNMDIKSERMRKRTTFEYSEIDPERFRLRISYKSLEIKKIIRENQVTILFGDIGCGKTTQIPQYILEDWLKDENEISNEKFGIIVSQPRRVNVISVAERVAAEKHEVIGKLIGYQVGLESKLSSYTRLTFCTERNLLERLSDDSQLESTTHIIVDQVHERSAESDFILMWLKKLIRIRNYIKVILISSTSEIDIFSHYFEKAAALDVASYGRYPFPSTEMFLEDIMEQMNYVLDESSEYVRKNRGEWKEISDEIGKFDLKNMHLLSRLKDSILDEDLTLPQVSSRYFNYSQTTRRNIYVMDHDKINYELIEKIVQWIIEKEHTRYTPICGDILIFLPDIEEITKMKNILEKSPMLANRKKYLIIPLHSNLSTAEQNMVFQKQDSKTLRIVLTTNIVESSICINDMYVKIIDSGKIKERRFNTSFDETESFKLSWISKANYFRRKSRAIRTYANYYIHLYSSSRFNHHLKVNQAASEISTDSLEPFLLRLKVLQKNKDVDFYQALGNMLEPPPTDHIEFAIKRLKQVGALDPEFMLTPLGYHLAALPVDARIGKLILFGVIFCCLDSTLTIAACLLKKSPFLNSVNQRQDIRAKRKEYATENSDQLTDLKVYKKWQEFSACSSETKNKFANENLLDLDTLHDLADAKYYLLQLLNSIGFVSINTIKNNRSTGEDLTLDSTSYELNINNDNYKLLKGLICATLYPNIARLASNLKSSAETESQMSNPEELRFLTTDNEIVYIHPSSINFNTCFHGSSSSQFLVFRKKMKKGKIFIQDTSKTDVIALALFCGYGIDIDVVNDVNCILSLGDNGYITFAVESLRVAQLLQLVRMELTKLLEQKIRNPQLDLVNHRNGRKIINAVVNIITNNS